MAKMTVTIDGTSTHFEMAESEIRRKMATAATDVLLTFYAEAPLSAIVSSHRKIMENLNDIIASGESKAYAMRKKL